METNNDKIFRNFFSEHKQDIADDGFSEKVMTHLPERGRKTEWIIPVFTLIGMLITLALVNVREMIYQIFGLLSEIPLYYLIGTFMLFPIVALLVMFYLNREHQLV